MTKMRSQQPAVGCVLVVLAYSSITQFDLAVGDETTLSLAERETLVHRGAGLTILTRNTGNTVGAAFRLRRGTVLMLAVPVPEPEAKTNRHGLSAVFAVFARHRVVPPELLTQILAALDLTISEICMGYYINPTMTANALTQLLQRRNDKAALDAASRVTTRLSAVFTPLLRSRTRRTARIVAAFGRSSQIGSTLNNDPGTSPHYAVATQAAFRMRTTRKDQICHYLPFSGVPFWNVTTAQMDGYRFLETGIVVSQTLPRGLGSYLDGTSISSLSAHFGRFTRRGR